VDLDEFIVAVYCLVDESIEEILGGRRLRSRGPTPLLDDREVLTMEVVGEFLGIDTDVGIRRFLIGHYAEWFPALGGVDRTTFARQGANLWRLKEELWRRLALREAPEARELLVVDSFPVPACRKTRSHRCKLLWEVATHGYDELAGRWVLLRGEGPPFGALAGGGLRPKARPRKRPRPPSGQKPPQRQEGVGQGRLGPAQPLLAQDPKPHRGGLAMSASGPGAAALLRTTNRLKPAHRVD
jgi:hypothetical protein